MPVDRPGVACADWEEGHHQEVSVFELFRAMRLITRGDELYRRGAYAQSLPLYEEALRTLEGPGVELATPWAYAAAVGALHSYVHAALDGMDRPSAARMLARWLPLLFQEPSLENVELDVARAELLELHRSLSGGKLPSAPP